MTMEHYFVAIVGSGPAGLGVAEVLRTDAVLASKPTLRLDRHVTPSDISSCYPTRITVDILEGLEMLDKVVTGINNDQNLVYAPEIKPTCSISLTDGVKTEVPRLYVCGDFSGYTRETNLLFFL
jgi:uncharacterized FAD-dependent dehydrogenase